MLRFLLFAVFFEAHKSYSDEILPTLTMRWGFIKMLKMPQNVTVLQRKTLKNILRHALNAHDSLYA